MNNQVTTRSITEFNIVYVNLLHANFQKDSFTAAMHHQVKTIFYSTDQILMKISYISSW